MFSRTPRRPVAAKDFPAQEGGGGEDRVEGNSKSLQLALQILARVESGREFRIHNVTNDQDSFAASGNQGLKPPVRFRFAV